MSINLAEEALKRFKSDRLAWLENIETEIESRPSMAQDFAREKRKVMEIPEWEDVLRDPVAFLLDSVSQPLVEVASAKEFRRAKLIQSVRFGMTHEEDVIAAMFPQDDESALITISDALAGSIFELSRMAATLTCTPSSTSMLANFTLALRAQKPRRDVILAMSLLMRYNFIQQRTFGLSGRMGVTLPERQEVAASIIAASAMRFVLGHETAHFLLEHGPSSQRVMTSQKLPPSRSLPDLEDEADRLGLIFSRESEALASGKWSKSSDLNCAFGAYVAILAISGAESGLLLRPGHSHPPASHRLQRIQAQLSSWSPRLNTVPTLLQTLQIACGYAADFSSPFSKTDWLEGLKHPLITAMAHSSKYYESMRHFDTLNSDIAANTMVGVEKFLTDTAVQSSHQDLGSAFAAARKGDAAGALNSLGIDSVVIERITDTGRALSYFTVQDAIFEELQVGASSTIRRMASTAYTSLLQGALR